MSELEVPLTKLMSMGSDGDSLLSYFTEVSQNASKDPKSNGLKKKIAIVKFICITALMMDAMGPFTVLSQFLQTENVDVALVKVKLDLAIKDLEKIKEMISPNLTAIASDIQGNMYRCEHQITRATFNLEKLCIKFIDNLISNMHSRLPNTLPLCAVGVMSLIFDLVDVQTPHVFLSILNIYFGSIYVFNDNFRCILKIHEYIH